MDLGQRIFNILKTLAQDQVDSFDKALREGRDRIFEEVEKWEKQHGINPGEPYNPYQKKSAGRQQGPQAPPRQQSSSYPQDFIDDLAVFGLVPPSSMAEVKKKRNQEIKKYHPDRFNDQPEKIATAKEILQLINTAYGRLEKHRLLK